MWLDRIREALQSLSVGCPSPHATWHELGLKSLQMVRFAAELCRCTGQTLGAPDLYTFTTPAALATHWAAPRGPGGAPSATLTAPAGPVAVMGSAPPP